MHNRYTMGINIALNLTCFSNAFTNSFDWIVPVVLNAIRLVVIINFANHAMIIGFN